MRTFFVILLFVTTGLHVIAQSPQSFQYQAVVRDASGNAVTNQNVGFQISIISGSITGTVEYAETHSATTNAFGIVTLTIGSGNVVTGTFSDIAWGSNSYFIKVEADPLGGVSYIDMGTTQLLSVPYALFALNAGNVDTLWSINGNNIYNSNSGNVGVGITNPYGKMVIQGDSTVSDTLPLFEIKNAAGQTVFVVYPDSVHVYVKDGGAKANKGGFAVSGRNAAKGLTNNYLTVSPDSTRIYLNEDIGNDGFAIKGINSGGTSDYLNVSVDTTEIINPSQPRVLWYPTKEAFLAGRVIIQDKDSVGVNSFASGFESKSIGNYSQAFGYQSRAFGDNSTAIGFKAEAVGKNSFAFGDSALAIGLNSIAIGSSLRDFTYYDDIFEDSVTLNSPGPVALGNNSLAIGYGAYAFGSASLAIGAQDTAFKPFSIAIGRECKARDMYTTTVGGYKNESFGWYSFIGGGQRNSTTGSNSTVVGGFFNQALGYGSSIFGGMQNSADGQSSCVAGGDFNNVHDNWNFIGGGQWNNVSGDYSSSVGGAFNNVTGRNATIIGGYYNEAHDSYETVLGHCATIGTGDQSFWTTTDRLFVIGNGLDWTSRSNAMMVLKNGEVYFPDVYSDAVGVTNKDLYIDNTGKIGFLSSSERYKKEIINMEDVDWIYKLRPVNYLYKTDNNKIKQYGLIAEEVEKINPLFVSYNKEGEVETVQYSKLVTPMLKALQEQKQIIEQLQKENIQFKTLLETKSMEFENLQAEVEKIKKYQSYNKNN